MPITPADIAFIDQVYAAREQTLIESLEFPGLRDEFCEVGPAIWSACFVARMLNTPATREELAEMLGTALAHLIKQDMKERP